MKKYIIEYTLLGANNVFTAQANSEHDAKKSLRNSLIAQGVEVWLANVTAIKTATTAPVKRKASTASGELFKQAHELTRATIQDGDDYRATFGLCLQSLMIEKRMAEAVYIAINYKAPSKPVRPVQPRKRLAIDFDVILMIGAIMLLVVLFIAGVSAISAMDQRNKASFDALYADDTAQVVTTNDKQGDKL